MKNKLKWAVSLAVILTLALLAFTGCVTEKRTYDISDIGTVTLTDAADDALSSCVVVEVMKSGMSYYYSVGLAVTENLIIVPRQTIPIIKVMEYIAINENYSYRGRVCGGTGTFALEYDVDLNNTLWNDDNCGFNILRVTGDTKLTPIKFAPAGTDGDIVRLGELMFGVEITIPDSNVWGNYSAKTPAAEYLRIMSVLVSSRDAQMGKLDGQKPFGVPYLVFNNTFTTNAYLSKSDYDTYMKRWDATHGFELLSSSAEYSLTNCMLFNVKGEFVGINYMRKTDNGDSNANVVAGIGYACRSNAIASILNKLNVKVSQ